MGKDIKEPAGAHELEPVSLSELIHQHVRAAIEAAVREELQAALGTSPYERSEVRRGYRNGMRELTLTGPTAPVVLAEIRDDFHRIAYAANADTARTAYAASERTWRKRRPGVVTSLREGGAELLTFFRFPRAAVVLLFSLVASGQIKLRRIDGWRKIAAVPANIGRWQHDLELQEIAI